MNTIKTWKERSFADDSKKLATAYMLEEIAELRAALASKLAGEAEYIDNIKPEDIAIESWDRHPRTGMQVGMPNGVRLIHKPTATVICVDINRSQHQNKSLAMDGLRTILEPKLWEKAEAKRMLDTAAMYQDLYSKAIERAEKAEAVLAARQAPDDELRAAAQAVIDRWETPLWKDAKATADYIYRLRAALAASVQVSVVQGWVSVEDRLPEMDAPVWLYEQGRGVWIGGRSDGGEGWLWCNAYGSQYFRADGTWGSSEMEIDEDY